MQLSVACVVQPAQFEAHLRQTGLLLASYVWKYPWTSSQIIEQYLTLGVG